MNAGCAVIRCGTGPIDKGVHKRYSRAREPSMTTKYLIHRPAVTYHNKHDSVFTPYPDSLCMRSTRCGHRGTVAAGNTHFPQAITISRKWKCPFHPEPFPKYELECSLSNK